MYLPRFNQMADAEVGAFVDAVGAAELITTGRDGYPRASRLPLLRDDGRWIFHLARANDHWRTIEPDSPALAVVTGPEAYVSPGWYATKREHGRVVPTWNYSAVHVTGRVSVHDDADWLREAVTRLTDVHERRRDLPWGVTDAPDGYITKQLRAIVGLELRVERVEAKAKLSQNRSDEDRAGAAAGMRAEGGRREADVADAMDAARDGRG
ncbi:MAG TPA: FMN-binding negative transcriptional regulator [Nocardioides sp.]|nr:FMN-binding negative transcriptional regulator [uncultured Nocardioides sp.]HEX5988520.1 FMN-binding negative transcriptional regulator [Nocardioides sp.]